MTANAADRPATTLGAATEVARLHGAQTARLHGGRAEAPPRLRRGWSSSTRAPTSTA
ncbi:hypothetical protein O1L60_45445 [Streptomyces diastatochromogenes]|nr:hypothetical protein [Streptomyces diastatochromogenes]